MLVFQIEICIHGNKVEFIYLFIYGVFYHIVSSSDHIAVVLSQSAAAH
jgi:hypothetical protein